MDQGDNVMWLKHNKMLFLQVKTVCWAHTVEDLKWQNKESAEMQKTDLRFPEGMVLDWVKKVKGLRSINW